MDWVEELDILSETEDELILLDSIYPPFYLKYIIENDILKEIHLEFIITAKMQQEYPELKIGTYDIKGTDSSSYESNKEIIKEAFGYSNNPLRCFENSSSFKCSIPHYQIETTVDGEVGSYLRWYACTIGSSAGYSCHFLGY